MRKAILTGFFKVIIISLLICSLLFSYFIGSYTMKRTEDNMLYTLALMDYSLNFNKDLQAQLQQINPLIMAENTRITILSTDGAVLADTSNAINYGENHLNREEVEKALQKGIGVSVRYSDTDCRNMVYAAYLSSDNKHILRLALPYNGISDFIKAIVPALLTSVLLAFVAAFVTAKKLAWGIAKPMSEISAELDKIQTGVEHPVFKDYKYAELDNFVSSIKILSQRIDTNIEKLRMEKAKIDYILDNMKEGLILTDESFNVIIINKTAREILNRLDNSSGQPADFTMKTEITNRVKEVMLNGRDCMFDLPDEKNEKVYFVHITPTKKGLLDTAMSVVSVLMIDVSAERQSQKVRQDFFSNASHELKTPITSIQGYCELLLSDMPYTDEQKKEFLARIKSSATNITSLVNDILMISRMEAGTESESTCDVNVNSIIEDVLNATELMRNERGISADVKCPDIVVKADYNKIYQLINNLITNATKYNKAGGNIYIEAAYENSFFRFYIKDTGIGIPVQAQQRVFERFYRVDKGRSRKMGGTGLGLAIVKHIVGYYKGTIKLNSEVEKGTEIEVILPLKG